MQSKLPTSHTFFQLFPKFTEISIKIYYSKIKSFSKIKQNISLFDSFNFSAIIGPQIKLLH